MFCEIVLKLEFLFLSVQRTMTDFFYLGFINPSKASVSIHLHEKEKNILQVRKLKFAL